MSAISAAFAAEQSRLNGAGWRPLAADTLTIAPPSLSGSSGIAARQARTAENRLNSNIARQSASLRSRKPVCGSATAGRPCATA